ncbi:MAG: phosphoethanolamine transferase [Formosimonas sp.]
MFFIHCIKANRIILTVAAFLTVFANWAFFRHVQQVYPIASNAAFVVSVAILAFCSIALTLSVLCIRQGTKPVLIVLLWVAAFAAYYMDTFDVVIDKAMIQNISQTNVQETRDLLTLKLLAYIAGLAILPSVWVYHQPIPKTTWRKALVQRVVLMGILLLLAGSQVLLFSKNYASFFREHKTLRYYVNPLTPINSAVGFLKQQFKTAHKAITPLGVDAQIAQTDTHRELVILVVGETARWDRFSLNGYNKPTNPLLAQEKIINFSNFTSCGTSTAVSVPCMFSPFGRKDYSEDKFKNNENLLDVLAHAGVNILWRDNNSDSKGVAIRQNNVLYQDYKDPKNNTVCDVECRDEGMLVGLQDYINQHPTGDIVIVLHQMGSHGPAYYKRYPAAFEQFKPACQNNLLEQCSPEEISNAYDNTILYTDYFLSKVIGLLKNNAPKFEAAMFYVSDHGESLGEKGVYLHGMPYAIAPEAQTHVGAMMWLSDNIDEINQPQLKQKEQAALSHDNLFHTVLGLLEIESAVYNAQQDILKMP